jgi:hypothetical protein
MEDIYIDYPKSCSEVMGIDGKVNCLKIPAGKILYGLEEAPRIWYFTYRKQLVDAGFTVANWDPCLFLLKKDGELQGMAGVHVDDTMMAGNDVFYRTMERVSKKVSFGARNSTPFVFCGARYSQGKDMRVTVDLEDYIKEIEMIEIGKERARQEDQKLTPQEVTQLRGALGSLQWATGIVALHGAYATSRLAGRVNDATIETLKEVNKAIQLIKERPVKLVYSQMNLKELVVYGFGDSNFRREAKGGSQGGHLIFIGQKCGVGNKGYVRANLLRWQTKRLRRVVHNTLAAETLACNKTQDIGGAIVRRLKLLLSTEEIPLIVLTDCRSLFENIYNINPHSTEELLKDDLHEIREACVPLSRLSPDYNGTTMDLWWIPTKYMLADPLTKSTILPDEMLKAIEIGSIRIADAQLPKLTNW